MYVCKMYTNNSLSLIVFQSTITSSTTIQQVAYQGKGVESSPPRAVLVWGGIFANLRLCIISLSVSVKLRGVSLSEIIDLHEKNAIT